MRDSLRAGSEDIYHRVYRLMQRKTAPPIIAAALNLPLRIVLNVISRIEKKPELGGESSAGVADVDKPVSSNPSFLEAYFITKPRYAILQLVGHVSKDQSAALETQLQKVQSSVWKAVAIRLSDVTVMDETGARMLLTFCEEMNSRERYAALLDPPLQVEPLLSCLHIEGKVPVFGTLAAFENGALSYKPVSSSSRPKSRPKPR